MIKEKKSVRFIVILLILLFILPANGLAQQLFELGSEELKPELAPPNPAFLDYIERREKGELELTTEEGYPLGFIPPVTEVHWIETRRSFGIFGQPVRFDLRDANHITPVKDQNLYNSCWIFATYGSLESYLRIRDGIEYDFSENNLMWSHGYDHDPNVEGGNYYISMAYLSRWSGPVDEADDPYPGTSAISGLSPVFHVQKVELIPQTEADIKQAIMESGALASVIYWESGNYDVENKSYYYSGESLYNHGVTIVGWDDNYNRNNFIIPAPGDGAWIIKNSWGTGWGEAGYFYLSYYDTHAGSYTTAFHNAEATDNYDRIYQYDLLGWVSNFGGLYEMYGANIYTALDEEYLKAISTYAVASNMSYEITVYTDIDAGDPMSGTLSMMTSGTLIRPGYHTVEFPGEVALIPDQLFSVVVRYTTIGYDLPIPVERALSGYSSNAEASAGQSFYSFNGTEWFDSTSFDPTMNICIKAFTRIASSSEYTISVSANPAEGGTVSGGGIVMSGANVTVAAIANTGYQFVNWTENGTVVSTSSSYSFIAGSDRTLVANFSEVTTPTPVSYTIMVSANPEAGGSVSGGGSFLHGSNVTVSAAAYMGYQFSHWSVGGVIVSTSSSYNFTAVSDAALVANFIPVTQPPEQPPYQPPYIPVTPVIEIDDVSETQLKAEVSGYFDMNYSLAGTVGSFSGTVEQGESSETHRYTASGKKDMVITTGWSGSQLRINVFTPDGKLYGRKTSSAEPPMDFIIQNAKQGEWTFTITGVDVPYVNYPYAVIAGELLFGDINTDGRVNVQDIVAVMRHNLKLENIPELHWPLVDVNDDGEINVIDATLMMRRTLGLIDQFPL